MVAVGAMLGSCTDRPETLGPAVHGPTADLAQPSSSGTLVITSNVTLTEDHYGNISIGADNVTLDCAGHTVFEPGVSGFSGGIEIDGRTGITVTHCTVTGFNVNGIFAGGSSNSRYEANILYGNRNHGMHLDLGSGNVVGGNTSRANGAIGIVFTRMAQSRIEGDTVQNNANWAGIALFDGSHNNVVVYNTASANHDGFILDGAVDNELGFNTANLNAGAGFLLIRGGATNNVLKSNIANQNGFHGFVITDGASSNTLQSNVANANVHEGFLLYQANRNMLSGNIGNGNGLRGFLAWGGSSFNTFTENIGHGNHSGVDAWEVDAGLGNVWTNNNFGTTLGI